MKADDLHPGQWVTVLRGAPGCFVPECPCECYQHLKGIPLGIVAVELPYVLCRGVGIPGAVVIDTRDCELMRVRETYAAISAALIGAVQVPPEKPEPPPQDNPGQEVSIDDYYRDLGDPVG